MIFGTFATNPRHHINVCRYVPSDEELQEIIDRQGNLNDGENVNEYSHKVIKIKKFSPREGILISILEDEDEEPQQYLYLAQALLSSGKPVGHFKTFDEYLPMRKCGEKEVFYNDENIEIPGDELLNGGVTFEWIAPNKKIKGSVTVLVTKVNMNLLHRHEYERTEQETDEPTD